MIEEGAFLLSCSQTGPDVLKLLFNHFPPKKPQNGSPAGGLLVGLLRPSITRFLCKSEIFLPGCFKWALCSLYNS